MTDYTLAAGLFLDTQEYSRHGWLLISRRDRHRYAGYFAQKKREEARGYY